MFRKNARLSPQLKKVVLRLLCGQMVNSNSVLGLQINLIVSEKVRQELTQKYEIHSDKTWSVDEF